MVLVAIVDSLVSTELEALVTILRRDGFVCLSSALPLEDLHNTVETKRAQPIVIYGDRSMDVPYDDCSRIWLCCGPTADNDVSHAAALHYYLKKDTATSFADFAHTFDADAVHENAPSPMFAEHLARRQRAVQCDFHFMTFPRTLSFMAEAIAPERVESMGLEDGVRRIVLRHVTK